MKSYSEMYRQELQDLIVTVENYVHMGGPNDYAEYRYHVGRWFALREAMSAFHEVERRQLREMEEEVG